MTIHSCLVGTPFPDVVDMLNRLTGVLRVAVLVLVMSMRALTSDIGSNICVNEWSLLTVRIGGATNYKSAKPSLNNYDVPAKNYL